VVRGSCAWVFTVTCSLTNLPMLFFSGEETFQAVMLQVPELTEAQWPKVLQHSFVELGLKAVANSHRCPTGPHAPAENAEP
jgi:hypothetical protein